jgi:hypothetical protein
MNSEGCAVANLICANFYFPLLFIFGWRLRLGEIRICSFGDNQEVWLMEKMTS